MDDHNYIKEALEDKKKINKTLKYIAIGFGVFLGLALVAIVYQLFFGNPDDFFNMIALAVIIVWFGILTGYYAWAIYFYNINLGLTDEDWAEIRERKKYNPEGVDEPKQNPNINQTLGLPTGTVRGTIALTLLVGGVAMTIAGLGMEHILEPNAFLVDNFEFFKTAFLMMIAFYFGNKSLELLRKEKPKDGEKPEGAEPEGDTDSPTPPRGDGGAIKILLKKAGVGSKKEDASKTEENDFDNSEAVL